MENIEEAKKQLFQSVKSFTDALTSLLQATDEMGWTDELLAYAEELDKNQEVKPDGQN